MEDRQRPLAAPLSREKDLGPYPRKRKPWLALSDLGEYGLQVGAGEGRVERSGDLAVVLAEAQQPIEVVEVSLVHVS
jgi:hypothetical protein